MVANTLSDAAFAMYASAIMMIIALITLAVCEGSMVTEVAVILALRSRTNKTTTVVVNLVIPGGVTCERGDSYTRQDPSHARFTVTTNRFNRLTNRVAVELAHMLCTLVA